MLKNFFTNKLIFVGVALLLIWLAARLPLWNNHLQVDIWVWWERIDYWFKQASFAGLEGNEILPLTLLYLFVPTFLIPVGWLSYANYLPAALLINLTVIAAHFYLVNKYAPKNLVFLAAVVIALGPILLFRFDALVTLAVLLSLLAFRQEKFVQSGFYLGLAAGMKVFPIIFLPYLLLVLLSKKQIRSVFLMLIYFGEALIIPALIFSLLGGNWDQILTALNFHNLKLISVESLAGSVITGWSLLTQGVPPAPLAGNGIWAVAGPAALFNRLWLIPVGLIYYFIWRQKRYLRSFSWQVPYSLMLTFLIFSKNLNPQYVWWFICLAPFVNLSRKTWGLILIIALTNQLVYPLFYTQLIEGFYQNNRDYWVYYLLLLRNFGILLLTVFSFGRLLNPKHLDKVN
jgi:hypothetical protein